MYIYNHLTIGEINSGPFFSQTVDGIGGEKKGSLSALSAITLLKKLCNHPDLVYEKIQSNTDGFEGTASMLPPHYSTKYVMNYILFELLKLFQYSDFLSFDAAQSDWTS